MAPTRRRAARWRRRLREIFASIPFIVDVDDSFGRQTERVRVTISNDDREYNNVEHRDVFDTLRYLYGGVTVGYSHRSGGPPADPDPPDRAAKGANGARRAALTTPVPANALPGDRGVVELGDVVRVTREKSSFPVFRRNGYPAEMVTAELAGDL